ncbi:permease prefix domain 1-containing protein [Saccharothrix sp. BKS2]|uniref:permease prefix domain 1-containing protein n=1 Tax=Saccharothrix sp. BKS2 TaxID=3064400 RepID=UPI0039E835B3
MTSTAELTERYVDAALRRLPHRLRPDIERELRASIADAVDARVDGGADPAAAERAALAALGDPVQLAAGYADRPPHLVGPAHYPDYRRLLTVLLATVVPAAAAAVGLAGVGRGEPVADVLLGALGAAATTGGHIALWTTALFALIERAPALRRAVPRGWAPEQLPELPGRRAKHAELVAATAALVLGVALVLLSPTLTTVTDGDGDPVGPLSPWLWDTRFVHLFAALLVVALGLVFARHYARWSAPVAVAAALVDVTCAVALVWLVANDRVLNPAFVTAAGWSGGLVRAIGICLCVLAATTVLHAVGAAAARTRR